jgi:uncharacterized protein
VRDGDARWTPDCVAVPLSQVREFSSRIVGLCFWRTRRDAPIHSLSARFRPNCRHWRRVYVVQQFADDRYEHSFCNGDAAEEEGRLEFARQSFERGAALGDPTCLTRLARMFDEGIGVDVDKREAMRLFQLAWRRGNDAVAATNIAILYREAGKRRSTFEWFCRAADTGDGSAQLDKAKCYLNGEGVRKDEQAALRCLANAVASYYISEYEREEAQALLENLRPKIV